MRGNQCSHAASLICRQCSSSGAARGKGLASDCTLGQPCQISMSITMEERARLEASAQLIEILKRDCFCQCCAMSGGISAWGGPLFASCQYPALEGSERTEPGEPKRGVPWRADQAHGKHGFGALLALEELRKKTCHLKVASRYALFKVQHERNTWQG